MSCIIRVRECMRVTVIRVALLARTSGFITRHHDWHDEYNVSAFSQANYMCTECTEEKEGEGRSRLVWWGHTQTCKWNRRIFYANRNPRVAQLPLPHASLESKLKSPLIKITVRLNASRGVTKDNNTPVVEKKNVLFRYRNIFAAPTIHCARFLLRKLNKCFNQP